MVDLISTVILNAGDNLLTHNGSTLDYGIYYYALIYDHAVPINFIKNSTNCK